MPVGPTVETYNSRKSSLLLYFALVKDKYQKEKILDVSIVCSSGY